MGPKRAKAARKRSYSPEPSALGSDTAPSPIQVRTRSKRALVSQSSSPPPRGICGGVFRTARSPSLNNLQEQEEPEEERDRAPYREHEPSHEERIDWYMEVAMEKLKGVLRRANEDKLSKADLWEFLTFGQHMYAGMKQQYDIDLNTALVERTVQNAAKGLTPLGQRDEFPWDLPAPRRCDSCSRVIVEDLDPLSPRRPWNSPPMTDAEVDKLNKDAQSLGAGRCGFRWSPPPPSPPHGPEHKHVRPRIIRCYRPPRTP